MLIKDIHSNINLQLQKVHSNQFDNFKPEEIDMIINQVQLEFVESILEKQGTDIFAKEDLKSLIRKNHMLDVIYPKERFGTPDSYKHFPNTAYAKLPQDYLYLLNGRTQVKFIENSVCDTECIDRNKDSIIEYIATLPYEALVDEDCVNFSNLYLTIQLVNAPNPRDNDYVNIPLFNLNDFRSKFKGLKEENDKFVIVKAVLEYLNRFNTQSEFYRTGGSFNSSFNNSYQDGFDLEYNNAITWLEVYWENYGEIYVANNFIFVTRNMEDILSEAGDTIRQDSIGGSGYVNANNIQLLAYDSSQILGTGTIIANDGAVTSVSNIATTADLEGFYCREVLVTINSGNQDALGIAIIENQEIVSVQLLSLVDERHPDFVANWNSSGLNNTDYWGIAIRIQTLPTNRLPVPNDLNDPLNNQYVREYRFKSIGYDTAKFCCATNPEGVGTVIGDNRMMDYRRIGWAINHPSTKPTPEKPLTTFGNNEVWVYSDGSFYPEKMYIDYVKMPRAVNYTLGITLEFNHRAVMKIINRAVEKILMITGDPRFQGKNQLTETRSE